MSRGWCQGCGRRFKVRSDGKMPGHKSNGDRCPGEDRLPAENPEIAAARAEGAREEREDIALWLEDTKLVEQFIGNKLAVAIRDRGWTCPVESQECLIRGECTNKCGAKDRARKEPA